MAKRVSSVPGVKFRWNPHLGSTGRYIDDKGRIISQEAVTRETEKVITGVGEEMVLVSEQLRLGEISLQQWYWKMRGKMKIVHALSAALSLGGWFNVKPSDWGRVGSLTKWQYERLTNFANEIASGKQALDGRFTLRVNMYAKAARGTGEEIARAVAAENGYTKERRILGVADHCRTAGGLQGCVELAEKGWEPIGTLPRIGDTPCRTNCHCHFIYE